MIKDEFILKNTYIFLGVRNCDRIRTLGRVTHLQLVTIDMHITKGHTILYMDYAIQPENWDIMQATCGRKSFDYLDWDAILGLIRVLKIF
uniref:Protein kinase domain-containing protein n=1 Tax=Syphacia muris TaxID=451379 RepID=A0A0N5AVS0_9BILA